MKATVVHSPLGIFAFDPKNRLVESIYFPKDPSAVAAILEGLNKGQRTETVVQLRMKLEEGGYDEIDFEDPLLASVFTSENVKVTVDAEAGRKGLLRKLAAEVAVEKGLFKSSQDLLEFVHDVSVRIARGVVRAESGRRDLMVIQAIQALDDLDHTFNLFANRLREWYGYHFSEMGGIINESDLYVRLVAALDGRSRFTIGNLTEQKLPSDTAVTLAEAARDSMGADLPREDLDEVVHFAKLIMGLHESKTRLERYLESAMQRAAPNSSTLIGPILSARLIAAAGGLGNLAKRSASTIQVLGAEKALFRSLRSGSRPPKHGLIFQHKDVHQAPRWQRGKIARALASKLAIAVRLDAYGGENRGKELLSDFEKRVKEIQAKYPQPPSRDEKSGRS